MRAGRRPVHRLSLTAASQGCGVAITDTQWNEWRGNRVSGTSVIQAGGKAEAAHRGRAGGGFRDLTVSRRTHGFRHKPGHRPRNTLGEIHIPMIPVRVQSVELESSEAPAPLTPILSTEGCGWSSLRSQSLGSSVTGLWFFLTEFSESLCSKDRGGTSRNALAGLCQFRTHDRGKPAFFGSLTLREFV